MIGSVTIKELVSKLDMNKDKDIPFRQKVSFEQRKVEAKDSRTRYPTKIPIVIEKSMSEKKIGRIDKLKWLVPHEMTIFQFSLILRQRLQCPPQTQFFLLINGRDFPPLNTALASIYKKYCDKDGYLYLTYSSQESFG